MGLIRIWVARNTNNGSETRKSNLKLLCETIGLSYNTAKKRKKKAEKADGSDGFTWTSEKGYYKIRREEIE